MNKHSINKMILLLSISSYALLFSCGKSETETEDADVIPESRLSRTRSTSALYYTIDDDKIIFKIAKQEY